jgi:hypothetical protein
VISSAAAIEANWAAYTYRQDAAGISVNLGAVAKSEFKLA